MTLLAGWGDFYVIVGAAAGALIGLQFVVMTLIANMPADRDDAQAGDAFSTPSVVHFCVVLLLSAVITAPWNEMGTVEILWGLVGLAGIVYSVVVARRMQVQTVYQPVFEDWLFHVLLPSAAYAVLAGSAFSARSHERTSLFLVGAAALLLLFIGIHNAWDTVTHLVFFREQDRRESERDGPSE